MRAMASTADETHLHRERIHEFMQTHYGEEPTGIICHPQTWWQIVEWNMHKVTNYIADLNHPRFMGIEVFRSPDIKENQFKVF